MDGDCVSLHVNVSAVNAINPSGTTKSQNIPIYHNNFV